MADKFDDGVDALGVAEEHAKRVLTLEEEEAQKLLRVYARVATRLRQRLRTYPRDTFTAQQMRATLLQLEAAMRAFENELSDEAKRSAAIMRERGTRDLVKELNAYNDYFKGAMQPVSLNAQMAAMDQDKRLINRYDVSIKTYSDSLRRNIATQLQDMMAERVGAEEIQRRLIEDDGIGKFFEGEAWRLRRIVRTELHGIYGESKLNVLENVAQEDKELRKALYHPQDNRTAADSLYLERLNLRPRVSQPFVYVWTDKSGKRYRRIFMAPPDRPNDRAILIPFHPSWD